MSLCIFKSTMFRLLTVITFFIFNFFLVHDLYAKSCASFLSAQDSAVSVEELKQKVMLVTQNLSKRQKVDIILKAARGEDVVSYFSPQVIAALRNRMNAESVGDLLEFQGIMLYDFDVLKTVAGEAIWNQHFKDFQHYASLLGVSVKDFTAQELFGLDLSKSDRLSWLLNPKKKILNRLSDDFFMKGKVREIISSAISDYKEDVLINELIAPIPLTKRLFDISEEEYVAIMNSNQPLRIYDMGTLGTELHGTEVQHWFAFFVTEAIVREEVEKLKKKGYLTWSNLSGRAFDQRILFLTQFPEFLPLINEIEKIVPVQVQSLQPVFDVAYEFFKLADLDDYFIATVMDHDNDLDIFSEITFGFEVIGTDIKSYLDDNDGFIDSKKQVVVEHLNAQFSDFLQAQGLDSRKTVLTLEVDTRSIIGYVQVLAEDGALVQSLSLTLKFFNTITSQKRYDENGRLVIQ
jgi:hypothetical protein